jgi:hypothetical protein
MCRKNKTNNVPAVNLKPDSVDECADKTKTDLSTKKTVRNLNPIFPLRQTRFFLAENNPK